MSLDNYLEFYFTKEFQKHDNEIIEIVEYFDDNPVDENDGNMFIQQQLQQELDLESEFEQHQLQIQQQQYQLQQQILQQQQNQDIDEEIEDEQEEDDNDYDEMVISYNNNNSNNNKIQPKRRNSITENEVIITIQAPNKKRKTKI